MTFYSFLKPINGCIFIGRDDEAYRAIVFVLLSDKPFVIMTDDHGFKDAITIAFDITFENKTKNKIQRSPYIYIYALTLDLFSKIFAKS